MAWIELPDPSTAQGSLADAFAAGEARYGQVLQTWRAVGMVEGAFEAYLPYLSAVVGPGRVPIRVKDLSALRVAVLNRCRYTISHRVASARRNDLDERDILAMGDPAAAELDEPLAAAVAFTDAVTLSPPTTSYLDVPQAVAPDVLVRCKAVFDEHQIAELTLSISLWNALARFHRVLGLDLDMPPPPPELEPR
ncbi:carboxymuconolactone decarboxylase family protein [Egicoccus sp. AB-alg6-2]|uniref:carboxymuconolactone decarboxylase family protein n=1 Tax=Egicoccus sp. AB-alg6-2 TaxID=3242692 RepID=UPI00359D5CB5